MGINLTAAQAQETPGAKPGAWNGKSTVPIDEWVRARSERARRLFLPGLLEGEAGRLHLVALVGVQDSERVRGRRGDARGAGRRRGRRCGLRGVPVEVEGLAGGEEPYVRRGTGRVEDL